MELFHAFDSHDGRTGADNLGAHLVEHVSEIDDLGLAGGITITVVPCARTEAMMRFSVAPTLANSRRDGGTAQTLGRICVVITVGGTELNAQGLKTKNVHIDLASTQVAAARHGNFGAMEAASRGP